MKIGLVGPGIMPIPPPGWGAVEILIWEYYNALISKGYDVTIINLIRTSSRDSSPNTAYARNLVALINSHNFDFVHVHYDCLYHILPHLNSKHKAITSHYGYLDRKDVVPNPDYDRIHASIISMKDCIIIPLSDLNERVYLKDGADPSRIFRHPNGANHISFRYSSEARYPDRSIYLGKIEGRKRQYIYKDLSMLYFVGNQADSRFPTSHPRYLGEWVKPTLYESLTDYANLVLLSDGEAHPLVVCEALIAGLGVVVSEAASANLDRSQPFIDVIPDDRLNDLDYVSHTISENQRKSVSMRDAIRAYGIANFSWGVAMNRYDRFLKSLSV